MRRTKKKIRDQRSTQGFFDQPLLPSSSNSTLEGYDVDTWTRQFERYIQNLPALIQQEETREFENIDGDLMPKSNGELWTLEELGRFDILIDKVYEQLMSTKEELRITFSESKVLKLKRDAESTDDQYQRTSIQLDLRRLTTAELHAFTYNHFQFVAFQNIEKVFEFGVEACELWLTRINQQMTIPDPASKMREPTLRQRFNIPMKLTAQEKEKVKSRPRKTFKALAAARELTRNCTMLVKEFQTLNKAISDEDSKPPKLPEIFFRFREAITADFPEVLRQQLYDLFFLQDVLSETRNKLQTQLPLIRTLLLTWIESDTKLKNGCWSWARDHLHEMPEFQKYEYLRAELFALTETADRTAEKVFDYFDSNGCSTLTAGIEKLMRVGQTTKAERSVVYKKLCDSFFIQYTSVETMVMWVDQAQTPHYTSVETMVKRIDQEQPPLEEASGIPS